MPTQDSSTAPQVNSKKAGETRNLACSFAGKLDSGETLTGSPTITSTPSGLTIASGAVNASALTIDDETVAVGKAVTCSVSGGTAGVTYTIKIVATSTSTPAQSLEGYCTLDVD